jgi:hypothetical protein
MQRPICTAYSPCPFCLDPSGCSTSPYPVAMSLRACSTSRAGSGAQFHRFVTHVRGTSACPVCRPAVGVRKMPAPAVGAGSDPAAVLVADEPVDPAVARAPSEALVPEGRRKMDAPCCQCGAAQTRCMRAVLSAGAMPRQVAGRIPPTRPRKAQAPAVKLGPLPAPARPQMRCSGAGGCASAGRPCCAGQRCQQRRRSNSSSRCPWRLHLHGGLCRRQRRHGRCSHERRATGAATGRRRRRQR